jgi:superfamily II DNA or RNA helicase
MVIPRYFPVHNYINCNIINKFNNGEDININHSITPRNSLQEKAMKYMLENNNGIIQLNPGVGKTVITIYTISERKKKSFILVHRDSLADQWKDEILKFTTLKENDISRLSSKNYEEDLSKSVIIATDQTFISILKKSERKLHFLSCLHKSNIGILIADECHTSIAAPSFSECSLNIPAKVTFGLSATPYRCDGNSDIINYHLGEIFTDDSTEGTMNSKVNIILLDYGIDIPYRHKYLYWEGQFQNSRYLNLIKNSKIFMNVCKGLLTKMKVDRDILFVCERIKLIDLLYNWIPEESKSKFIAGSKNEDLKQKIVFSTPGKIRDGVNIPQKDCLILTSPISNITQICGRVIRTHQNKKEPLIIDLVDIGCTRISNTIYTRLKYYKSKNWKINYFYISNNKPLLINEEQLIKILKGEYVNEDKK